MASEGDDDKPARVESPRDSARESVRSPYGPRPLSALLPALVRPAFRGRMAMTAQVLADWPAIVGPAFAPLTTPRRLTSGTLTIACSGPMAMELQHVAPALMERVNTHLGHVAVTRLRFVQSAPPRPTAPPAAAPAPGEVRDALERLGRVVLARDTR